MEKKFEKMEFLEKGFEEMAGVKNWGFVGTGVIVRKFLVGLAAVPGAKASAVVSRDGERAREFATEYGMERAYTSCEELAADPDIQIVYIGTPNQLHVEEARLFLENGKAVLCEKPFAMSEAQMAGLVALAREKGTFLMEAMWTKFLPVLLEVRELVRGGVIGELLEIRAEFGWRSPVEENHRLYRKDYGGGALFDIGVYPLALAQFFLGRYPDEIRAAGIVGDTDVDVVDAIVLHYEPRDGEEGCIATLHCALRSDQGEDAWVYGSEGRIFLPHFYKAEEAIVYDRAGKELRRLHIPHPGNGYEYEVAEVMRCIAEGRIESEGHSFCDMVELAQMTEECGAQIHGSLARFHEGHGLEEEGWQEPGLESDELQGQMPDRHRESVHNTCWPLVLAQLSSLSEGETDWVASLANASALLMGSMPGLNWAGFYRAGRDELVLGPFQGKPACVRLRAPGISRVETGQGEDAERGLAGAAMESGQREDALRADAAGAAMGSSQREDALRADAERGLAGAAMGSSQREDALRADAAGAAMGSGQPGNVLAADAAEEPMGAALGVCAAAALQDKTVRVPDVHAFPGHIACDSASRSEIVVPFHVAGRVAGVLDLDSPFADRFTEEDQRNLEEFVRILERAWENQL